MTDRLPIRIDYEDDDESKDEKGNGLPLLVKPPNGPKQEHSGHRAARVNNHVSDPSLSVWDKKLMDFVTGCIQRHEQDGEARVGPAPRPPVVPNRFTQRSPQKQCEHRVFSQVGAFADKEDDIRHSMFRKMREKPMNDRRQNPGRMLKGHGVTRRGKDNHHPEQHREPIFNEWS